MQKLHDKKKRSNHANGLILTRKASSIHINMLYTSAL